MGACRHCRTARPGRVRPPVLGRGLWTWLWTAPRCCDGTSEDTRAWVLMLTEGEQLAWQTAELQCTGTCVSWGCGPCQQVGAGADKGEGLCLCKTSDCTKRMRGTGWWWLRQKIHGGHVGHKLTLISKSSLQLLSADQSPHWRHSTPVLLWSPDHGWTFEFGPI